LSDVDVLVVGAGPVGLFLACELLRRGHTCTIVERNSTPPAHSKALAIMPRTLQMFEHAGICDEFLAEVNRVRGVRFVTPRSSAYVGFSHLDTPYPFVSILPQWKTESLLRARLQQLGGTVLYGHEFTGFEGVRARYVAACDGVGSTVRKLTGIPFTGRTYEDRALLADIRVKTPVPLDEARVHIDRTGMVTLFPINESVRRIVVVSPREALPDPASREWLQARIERAAIPAAIDGPPLWVSTFGVHRRVARRMRAGNVFLAGDAAHAHSPVGGQGMNVGFEDAWILAGLLSSVLHGYAHESQLDRYERLRLPAARAVVRHTDLLLRALAHPSRAMRVGREYLAPYIIRIPALRERVVRELLTA
jgi:2-polyprenyl-6-methoxyphenol hydroxylase-like FAD-dependent oxidoreductase